MKLCFFVFQALTCWFCFIVISNTKYFPGGEVIGLLMENSILGITDIESSKKKGRCIAGTISKLKSFIRPIDEEIIDYENMEKAILSTEFELIDDEQILNKGDRNVDFLL